MKSTGRINMKKYLTVLATLILFAGNAIAQTNDLSAEVKETLKRQAQIKVDELTNHISFIMQKSGYSDDVKNRHIKSALNLFLGKGNKYQDEYGNEKPAPTMEVSSKTRMTKVSYPVALYLQNIKYLNYDTIEITSTKSSFYGDIHKISENKYEAVLTFVQIFIGRRGDMEVYKDKTQKAVKVQMTRIPYEDASRWEILLGDTTVTVTE